MLIDCCSTCGGSWLDGGELEVICTYHRQGEELKEEVGATAIFEVIGQFLASLFSQGHLFKLGSDSIKLSLLALPANCELPF